MNLSRLTPISRSLSSALFKPRHQLLQCPTPTLNCISSRLSSTLFKAHSRTSEQQPTQEIFTIGSRYKSSKKSRARSARTDDGEEEEEDEDDDDEDANENPLLTEDLTGDEKILHKVIDIQTVRLDNVARSASAMTRTKIEELFYKGGIYVNGRRASKKSDSVTTNDEIDIISGPDPENLNNVLIKRITIVELPEKVVQDRSKVKVSYEELSVPNDYGKRDEVE